MVLAFYHHKLPIPFNRDDVKRVADKAGFRFPVAVDNGWKNLDRWWLEGENRHWTSVSFLIDKEGVIRHIHPGGSYAQGSSDYEKLKAKIEELLEETPEG